MKTISSTEFRRTYHALTEPTLVMAGGHTIGIWAPAHTHTFRVARIANEAPTSPDVADGPEFVERDTGDPATRFTQRPGPVIIGRQPERSFAEFRPVPKPGKGR